MQTTDTAFSLSAGSYSVIVTDGNGCQDSGSVTINSPFMIATAWPDTSICLGQSVQLNAGGGNSYAWSPSAGLSDPSVQNPLCTPTSSADYMVVVTSGTCAPDTAYVTVTVNPLPSVFSGNDTTIALGSMVQLSGSGGVTYNWTPSIWLNCTACPNPIAKPEESTTYIMMVTDANNCSNSDSIRIDIDKNFVIFIPDIFSPNSADADNKVFYVRGKGIREIISLVIYDRWGEKVFENKNFNENDASRGWDGSYKGNLMNPGVFVYIIEFIFENDERGSINGDVTLVH